MATTTEEVKEERIRGRDLKIAERDIFLSLSFFASWRAYLFGGLYGVGDPQMRATDSQLPRVVMVYIPPIWKRFYYKRLYKLFHTSKLKGIVQDDKR